MNAREPGDDDDIEDAIADGEDDDAADEAGLVPLGDVLVALDAERQGAAQETARDLLKRSSRTPPHAMDAERAVLGALLLEPACYDDVVETGLQPQDFYRPHHGTIYGAIAALRARNEPADTLTVTDELLRIGQLDRVGGAAAVSQLEALLPTAAHAGAYARLVHEKALLRRVIENATRIVTAAYAQDRPITDLLELAQNAFADLTARQHVDEAGNRRRIVREIMGRIGKPGQTGLSTGWFSLDHGLLQRGLRRGQLWIVGARPGMGKTAFGAQLAANVADELGVAVAFISLEMTEEELLEREIAGRAQLSVSAWPRSIGTGRLQLAAGHVEDRDLLRLRYRPGISLGEITALARREVATGAQLIVIDYLGLIKSGEKYRGNRTQEIGEVSRALKALAGQLMVPVVCLSQLNRKGEERRPELTHLRDSGDVEQDADAVILLHRPEYFHKEKTPQELHGVAEIIVAKQRNGPTGIANLHYQGDYTKFLSLQET